MHTYNFMGFLLSFTIFILAFLVMGLTGGFLASLAVVACIAGGVWFYHRYLSRKPPQRFQTLQFGAYTFRMEVA